MPSTSSTPVAPPPVATNDHPVDPVDPKVNVPCLPIVISCPELIVNVAYRKRSMCDGKG